MSSTSDGGLSELAKRIIELGGGCFGAAYEYNFSVRHVCIEKIEDLPKIRQSKYYQSIIGNVYNEVLDNLKKDKYVLFCGTPCQTVGLSNFLGKGYKEKYPKLILLDFICHSVNSPIYVHFFDN